MRRHLLRTLTLAAALTALAVPVFSMTNHAAACSVEGCTVYQQNGSTFDTFISPLAATIGSVDFGEIPTQAQDPGSSTVLSGSVDITVYDQRGNNQGFSVWLGCNDPCLTTSLAPAGIPDDDFSVSGPPSSEDVLLTFGDGTGGEAYADGGVPSLVGGASLEEPVLVGGECSWQIIGMSTYNEVVPVTVDFPNEFLTLPASWTGNFYINVIENAPPSGCAHAGEVDNGAGSIGDF